MYLPAQIVSHFRANFNGLGFIMFWFWKKKRIPKLLDCFCGAGGAAMGYSRAGFEIVGVDINPQPRYPFEFIQADAMEFLSCRLRQFAAIHASPPCQQYTALNRLVKRRYPDLIAPVRDLLIDYQGPFVIENVFGAPLINPIMLCGSMFGLRTFDNTGYLQRHRYFESNFLFSLVPECRHLGRVIGVYGGGDSRFKELQKREVMQIDWMTRHELNQAIPPVYTKWLGSRLIAVLGK
jgi:DNA (cytosine-5)-methyltransferase 1